MCHCVVTVLLQDVWYTWFSGGEGWEETMIA